MTSWNRQVKPVIKLPSSSKPAYINTNQPSTNPRTLAAQITPFYDRHLIKDAECVFGNEFLVACHPKGQNYSTFMKFSDIENQLTQCYNVSSSAGADKWVCNIKKDTELAQLSAGMRQQKKDKNF